MKTENKLNSIFDFDSDHILENGSVLLRPLTINDYDNLVLYAENEPEIWKYSVDDVIGRENFKKYINRALEGRQQKKEYPFIVFDKKSGRYAGSTRFYDIQPNHGALKLGYTWYGKDFQGTALNKNCKYLLLEFAFEKMRMNRFALEANNNNTRSIAAMKSIGCTVEGIMREAVINFDGSKRDTILLSILRSEWNYNVKRDLAEKINKMGAGLA